MSLMIEITRLPDFNRQIQFQLLGLAYCEPHLLPCLRYADYTADSRTSENPLSMRYVLRSGHDEAN
jgi:hypothetical protein